MKIPHPLNTKEQYLYAINVKLDTLIELLSTKEEQEPAPAPRKARAKKEA